MDMNIKKSSDVRVYDEVLLVTDLVTLEVRLLRFFYFLLALALEFFLHAAHRVLHVRSLDLVLAVAPMRGELRSCSCLQLTGQLSSGVHVVGVDWAVALFGMIFGLPDCLRREVSCWLVFRPGSDKKSPFFLMLALVVEPAIHRGPSVVKILI